MELVTHIKLDREERAVLLNHAVPHIGLAYTADPDPEQRPPEARVLNHMAQGDATSATQVEFAIASVMAAHDRAVQEATPEWWRANCFRPADGDAAVAPGTLPLVTDPTRFCQDMADNRAGQARSLAQALDLLERCHAVLTNASDLTRFLAAA
jgi:hypothetical protein